MQKITVVNSDFHLSYISNKNLELLNNNTKTETELKRYYLITVPIMYTAFTDVKPQPESHGIPVTDSLVVSGNLDSNWVGSQSLGAD